MLELACNHLQQSTSDSNILVKSLTIELGKLEPHQQLFTKKAINNILFEAHLKTLHCNSVKTNHSCVCLRSLTPIYMSVNSNVSLFGHIQHTWETPEVSNMTK